MLVHLYGQMCDMKSIMSIAKKYSLKVLEDCAHCVEGEREGVKPGQISDAACFSFYATKNLTCGEGGAVITNNLELSDHLKALRLHGMDKSAANRYTGTYNHWDMHEVGYKANLDDIKSSLLIHQIDRLEDQLKLRENLSKRYENAFSDHPEIFFPIKLNHSKHARHLFTIWVTPQKRDSLIQFLQEKASGMDRT